MRKLRILVILASPRKGNSAYAAKKFAKAVKGRKTFVDINKLRIKPCEACHKCARELKCKFDDDAAWLMAKVDEADVVIVASPVYFTGVPGPLKTFIDRNQLRWEQIQSGLRNPDSGNKGNTHPVPRAPRHKKGIIILTAGSNSPKQFAPAESEIRSFFAVNRIRTARVLKFGNMDEKGEMKKNKSALKKTAKAMMKNG